MGCQFARKSRVTGVEIGTTMNAPSFSASRRAMPVAASFRAPKSPGRSSPVDADSPRSGAFMWSSAPEETSWPSPTDGGVSVEQKRLSWRRASSPSGTLEIGDGEELGLGSSPRHKSPNPLNKSFRRVSEDTGSFRIRQGSSVSPRASDKRAMQKASRPALEKLSSSIDDMPMPPASLGEDKYSAASFRKAPNPVSRRHSSLMQEGNDVEADTDDFIRAQTSPNNREQLLQGPFSEGAQEQAEQPRRSFSASYRLPSRAASKVELLAKQEEDVPPSQPLSAETIKARFRRASLVGGISDQDLLSTAPGAFLRQ